MAGILAFLLYAPGLSGPFLFDDRQNILQNPAVQPEALSSEALRIAWLGNQSGPLGRPVASLSFALDFLVHGLNPWGYKLSNLLLHLLSCAALYGFLSTLLRAGSAAGAPLPIGSRLPLTAGLAALLWLLHPLHASTVLYPVQRMAILAALFCFLGLWAYLHGRLQQLQGRRGWPWLLIAMPSMTAAAALSKENGLLLPLLCVVCEWTFLRFRCGRPEAARALRRLYSLLVATAVAGILVWGEALWRDILAGYGGRPFTLEERLLTEARVIWWYLQLLATPDVAAMNLYHDDFALSTNWLSPPSTLPAVILLFATTVAAIFSAHRYPLPAFAWLFFLVGHSMESSVIPLELIFEHRNYLPSAGLALLASAGLIRLGDSHPRPARLAGGALLLLFASLLAWRSWIFADEFRLLLHSLQHHPNSVRTQLWAGDAYRALAPLAKPDQIAPLREQAIVHYRKAAQLSPNDTIGLYEVLIWDADRGHPPDPAVLEELKQRLSRRPPNPGTIVGSREFAQNIAKGTSAFPAKVAIQLLEALVANPRIDSEPQAIVLQSLAGLHWFEGDRPAALDLYRRATTVAPRSTMLWINLAAAAMQAGEVEVADEALKGARAADPGSFRTGLDLLAEDIAALRKTPPQQRQLPHTEIPRANDPSERHPSSPQ